jgi:hypothetical protein
MRVSDKAVFQMLRITQLLSQYRNLIYVGNTITVY